MHICINKKKIINSQFPLNVWNLDGLDLDAPRRRKKKNMRKKKTNVRSENLNPGSRTPGLTK